MRRLVVAVLAAALLAVSFLAMSLLDDKSNTYADAEAGWSVAYPEGWHVEASGTGGAVSEQQAVTFANFAMRRAAFRIEKREGETIGIRAGVRPPADRNGKWPADGVAIRVFRSIGGPILRREIPRGTALLQPAPFQQIGEPRPFMAFVGSDETGRYQVLAWIGGAARERDVERLADTVVLLSFERFAGRRVALGRGA